MHPSAFQKIKFPSRWKERLYYLLQVGLLAIVYHVTARLGILPLEEGQRGVMLLSLSSGVALAALLLFGTSLWPGIVIGLFIFKIQMGVPLVLILFESVGKVFEAVIAVWLLHHFQFQNVLTRVYDVLLFFIIVILISPLLGASISTIGSWLYFSQIIEIYVDLTSISRIWLISWFNEGIGMLVITSTLLTWRKLPPFFHTNLRLLEWCLLLVCLTVVSALTLKVEHGNRLILLYMILPFAVWAAIRFEQQGATISTLLVSGILINGGLNRILPSTLVEMVESGHLSDILPSTFQMENMRLIFLEMGFITITSLTALLVAAAYSERHQAEKNLLEEKEHLLTTFHSMADAMITTNAIGLITYLNPVAEELSGWSNKQAQNRMVTDIFRVKREPTNNTLENWVERCLHGVISPYQLRILIDRDHQEKIIKSSIAPIRNRCGDVKGMMVVFHDVSEEHKPYSHHATHDDLTGLYNRPEFEYQLKTLIYQVKAIPACHTLLYLNLDQFEKIDTRYGNMLLKQWVDFLWGRVRQGDLFARLDGDNFAILLKNCSLHHAETVATDFIKVTQKFDFVFDNQLIKVNLSIGVVSVNVRSENFMRVLNRAELACCAAKEQGGNRVYVHDEEHCIIPKR